MRSPFRPVLLFFDAAVSAAPACSPCAPPLQTVTSAGGWRRLRPRTGRKSLPARLVLVVLPRRPRRWIQHHLLGVGSSIISFLHHLVSIEPGMSLGMESNKLSPFFVFLFFVFFFVDDGIGGIEFSRNIPNCSFHARHGQEKSCF